MKRYNAALALCAALAFLGGCGTDVPESPVSTAAAGTSAVTTVQTSVKTATVSQTTAAASEITIRKIVSNSADIVGKWFYQPDGQKTAGTLTINANGTFDYTDAENGKSLHGTVLVEDLWFDEIDEYRSVYQFVENSRIWADPWLTVLKSDADRQKGILQIGLSGDGKLISADIAALVTETPQTSVPETQTAVTAISESAAELEVSAKVTAKTTTVVQTTAAQPAENPLAKIIGDWKYVSAYDGMEYSSVSVYEDGSFSEMGKSWEGSTSGTVRPEDDWFNFYDEDGQLYLGFKPKSKDAAAFIDDRGEGLLINAADPSAPADDRPKPDSNGFYVMEDNEEPEMCVDVLAGIWHQEGCDVEILTIKKGNDPYTGTFTYDDGIGDIISGKICRRYLFNQGNEKEYLYAFYLENSDLWYAFCPLDSDELNSTEGDLFGYMSGEPHFIRIS